MEKSLVPADKPYLVHLTSSTHLETSYEEIRAGFVQLALERNRRATPYVEQARSLKAAALLVRTPTDLTSIAAIQLALLTAAGVSDKASKHLKPADKLEAIHGLISNFLEPAGANFAEEVVFRFLLTRGDTLGGSMRNVGGALAQRKLSRAIIASLTLAKIPLQGLQSANNTWIAITEDNADVEIFLRGLSWRGAEGNRTLIYNLTVPLVRNNIDLCLLRCSPSELRLKVTAAKNLTAPIGAPTYLAFGELKGGIDPAGADEHWKTAKTALTRIRSAFERENLEPQLFFVGAAIAKKMAQEIWADLENGLLTNATNLTDMKQLTSLSAWLTKV
jgi:hypothetical protein